MDIKNRSYVEEELTKSHNVSKTASSRNQRVVVGLEGLKDTLRRFRRCEGLKDKGIQRLR